MRRILLCLDGSPLSETATPFATALASGGECELHLLSVWDVLPEEAEAVGVEHALSLRDHGLGYFRAYLNGFSEKVQGCAVTCEVRCGHPALEIMLAAAELGADLIVMASHGRRGVSERRRGSVADKVLRGSRVPVLVIGPQMLKRGRADAVALRSLLVPLDGGRESESAIPVALEFAETTGAGITLLRVVAPVLSDVTIGLPEAYPPELDRQLVRSAEEYLARLQAAHADRVVSTEVRRGRPAEAIMEHVARTEPDLVVMASRSRYSWGQWTLGSVADDVIEGPVPVAVVHPGEAAMEPPGQASPAALGR